MVRAGRNVQPGPANVAVAQVANRLLAIVERELSGARASVDPDALHDFRVAVRRTRTLQRRMRGVFPGEPLSVFRTEFRRLQQATGAARDLEVMREELERRGEGLAAELGPGVDALIAVVDRRYRFERGRSSLALGAKRTTAALSGWAALLAELDAGTAVGPDAFEPIENLAGARIDRLYGRFRRAGRKICDDSPAEALHELRKQGKELRYLLEFFGELRSAEVAERLVADLKRLQDVLGRHQDRAAQAQLLESLRREVEASAQSATAGAALTALIEVFDGEQAAARAQFAERFEPFAEKRRRALVRETFG